MNAPARTLDQRLVALDHANAIRSHRARLKRDVRAGRAGLRDLLADRQCETMKLFDALLCLRQVGRVKANRTLRHLNISPSKTVGGLSDRQRKDLTEWLS